MLALVLVGVLLVLRYRFVGKLMRWIEHWPAMDWGPLFLLTLSFERSVQALYLIQQLNAGLEIIIIGLLASVSLSYFGAAGWAGLSLIMIIIVRGLRLLQQLKNQQAVLLERLKQFLYYYEMALMRGQHQYLALREADQRSGLFQHYADVDQYIAACNQLYSYAQWMVIKKLAILLQRHQSFSNADLSGEFMELARELHQRYVQNQRLKLERRENLMLLPMTLNMLLMILYLVLPFIRDYI